MKCLLLGGGGFLGSHLCNALLRNGDAVRIFDRPNLKHFRAFSDQESVEWVEGDFLNENDVVEAVAGCDIVVHLACTTLPRSSNDNPAYDVETNVAASIRLLHAACRNGVRKVIFSSSGGTVYGIPEEIPVKETHPTDPICSYGIAKLAIEKYLHLFYLLHGLDYCVLRLSNPFGERQRISAAQGAVTVFLHKALSQETVEVWGDGSVVRDYFYVGDAVNAFMQAMTYSGSTRVFNIGAGAGRSVNQILDAIQGLVGRPVDRVYLPGRPFDVPINVLDISQARTLLKWEPSVSFSEGLSKTLTWMKDHER